ncbi:lipocalin Cav p 2.0101 precursor [Cavia porcellus]|uniref:Lipocalin Cav p 2.0101 n=1 Tax=Cavia porcellus TaxID=10141 RepID=AVP2_CAVPO|nr:lipocalin Cav p 2.0101 precursor [Cavia porcellus]P83508.2 RecName: Full=Lipocalin Cav p 2.0101; AltName: Full=Major allergen Cav p 2; AltName: Allergen=Cav p 2.0101; Flags: Precursor [Cavia porcellus]CAX62129.1 allergen lipocalin Cav p 2.0101 precursor [Cavia porcellus]
MMQILLLALAVSLACADSIDYSKVPGNWRTIAIAADHVEKIEVNGELRAYFRQVDCTEGCDKISITFYTNTDGVCTEHTVVGARNGENDVYTVDYAGENTFQILCNSDDAFVIGSVNTDQNGQTTKEVAIAAKRNFLTPEQEQKFQKAVQNAGIPLENIRYVIETDTCPD